MSSNFWHSSHSRYHLHTRTRLLSSRSTDLRYCTPRQLYCLGIWFSNLIQKLGKRLLLRQIPIATATVFFRRFYLKNSFCETNPYLVLAACVFVAAKVEETPVHIKSVVSEAKLVFAENNIKLFPAEPNKLGEMEFYLLEDLDFHLIVFHPYRALLHICGREPADGGKFDKARVEEDVEVRRKETEARKRREEEARRAAGAGIKPNDKAAGVLGESGRGAGGRSDKADEEESEEKRIRRLMGRGTGEGLMEIEEGVLQICLFLINDTYRTDVHLLYPPYIIALAVLYIGFCLTAMNNATSTRTRSSSSQLQTLASSLEINTALGLPPPPPNAAEFIASFEVSMPVLLACVQDIIVLYPMWETFEPSQRAGGASATSGAAGSSGAFSGDKVKESFGVEEAEALVRRMIQERMVDVGHPDNAGAQSSGTAQVVGKKRKA